MLHALQTREESETEFLELEARMLRLQRFQYRKEIGFPQHCHDELSVVICTGGVIESTQFGARETLRRGDVIVTNRRVMHASKYVCEGGPASGIALELDREMQRRVGMEGKLLLGRLRLDRLDMIVQDLLRELDERRPHWETMRMALVQEILVKILRGWPSELIRDGLADESEILTRREFVETTASMQRGHLAGGVMSDEFERRLRNTTGLGASQFWQSVIMNSSRP
jgi:hypothetical protein